MTKQEEQKIMLDILKSEFRCKNYICDKEVIFCSQCSNVTYSDEEIADALRYAIECIEKCEQFEHVTRLNRQYIDRVKNSGLGKNKSIEYIERHLVESTRSLIDWSDNE